MQIIYLEDSLNKVRLGSLHNTSGDDWSVSSTEVGGWQRGQTVDLLPDGDLSKWLHSIISDLLGNINSNGFFISSHRLSLLKKNAIEL